MREIGGKKGRGGWESYSVYMQRVYRDVYCVCTQKMTCCDGLSVKSLLCGLSVSQSYQTYVSMKLILSAWVCQSLQCMRLREQEPEERIQLN